MQALMAGTTLALLTAAFFWQILFTPNAWMPAGGGDLVPFLYPNYHFAAQYLRQGIIPLWNPHLYSGIPFAADPQSGLFYPINLIVFLLTPELMVKTLESLAVFHFWLAGFGMYLYLQHSPLARRLAIHPTAAMAGAIAFEFSDLFIFHFGNLNMIAVAAWLPLVMLSFQKGVLEQRSGWAATSGALLAVATLAGHIQITLFILLALALYAFWQMFFRDGWQFITTRKLLSVNFFKPLQYLLLTLLITIGLSALWLIPTLEMSQHTLRAGLSYGEAAAFSLNPAQLIGLLIPNYFGRDPALHWGPWDRVEAGYLGILPLLLAMVAVVLQKDGQTRFLAVLAMTGFLLALGRYSILHGWLSLSPGFGQFRAPARYILLLDFALAGLAGVGLHRLMNPLSESEQNVFSTTLKTLTWVLGGLTVISLPLAYYALLVMQDRNEEIFRRAQAAVSGVTTFAILVTTGLVLLHLARRNLLKGKALGIGAVVVIVLDLFSLGANVDLGYTDPTTGFDHPDAIQYLQAEAGINRVEVTTDIWHMWQPDTALLYNLYDTWGVYNPLTLADMTRYWQQVWPRSSGSYNFLGIKHIVASKAGAPADGDIVPIYDADPAVNIYLNRNALPRPLFVTEAFFATDHEAAWQAIKSPDFDPSTTVILEASHPPTQLSNHPTIQPPNHPTTQPSNLDIALLRYDLHSVEIGLTSDVVGYLVLSDAYYPGWQATIDGQPAPLYRANYAFRAVPVTAGVHTVRMEFKPASWLIGLSLTGMTLLVLVGWAGIKVAKSQGRKVARG